MKFTFLDWSRVLIILWDFKSIRHKDQSQNLLYYLQSLSYQDTRGVKNYAIASLSRLNKISEDKYPLLLIGL